MVIGLVAEQKKKFKKTVKDFFRKREKIFCIDSSNNQFEVVVYEVSCSGKKLIDMDTKRFKTVLERACESLKKNGAEKVVATEYIKWLCFERGIRPDGINLDSGDKLFLQLVPEFVRRTAAKCSMDLMRSTICISSDKMDRISAYLIRELCYDTKRIIFLCRDYMKAKRFCDDFYDETGFSVKLSESFGGNTDIFIDTEENILRFGRDLYVTGADFGFDFEEYEVNMLDVAACLKRLDADKMICLYDYGKNKLTL